jgi:hypothetical protein
MDQTTLPQRLLMVSSAALIRPGAPSRLDRS